MSPCDEYLELISARLDGELSPFEEKRLEVHLAQCGACRELADQLADLHDAMAELPRLPVPAGLTEQICAAVDHDTVTSISKKKSRRWKSLASLAAVLVLAVAGVGIYGRLTPTAPPAPSYVPQAQNDQAVFAVGPDDETPPAGEDVPAVARAVRFPDQDVLALCAADLFPNGRLTAEPLFDPEQSALTLELADVGSLVLTCTHLDPEGTSTVELAFEDGSVLTYLVELTAGTVTPAE